MKKFNVLTLLVTIPTLLAGCEVDRREMPHQWRAWEPVVSMDQKTAFVPRCPGWDYSIDTYIPPEGEADFGCATASNLAMMAARPKDFNQGRGLVYGDAQRNDLAVERYRTNKVTPLLKNEKIINTK